MPYIYLPNSGEPGNTFSTTVMAGCNFQHDPHGIGSDEFSDLNARLTNYTYYTCCPTG